MPKKTDIKKAPQFNKLKSLSGWAHRDLNPGPPDYESGALTS